MIYPRWASRVLLVMAFALVPWTAWIAWRLPERAVARHWDLAWAGFDAALVAMLTVAAVAIAQRKPLALTVVPVIATLLICDAWFDVVTAGNRTDRWFALGLALLVELPAAGFCLWLTHRTHMRAPA